MGLPSTARGPVGPVVPVRILPASIVPGGFGAVRRLLRAYAREVGADHSFPSFEEEVRSLPGAYTPPRGGLWIALAGREAVGCVAIRPLSPDVAELKRIYLRPRVRGHGVGRRLAEGAVAWARLAGYRAIRLDTLPSMEATQELYRRLGFRRVAAYRFNPMPGASFWELRLATQPPPGPRARRGPARTVRHRRDEGRTAERTLPTVRGGTGTNGGSAPGRSASRERATQP